MMTKKSERTKKKIIMKNKQTNKQTLHNQILHKEHAWIMTESYGNEIGDKKMKRKTDTKWTK